MPRRSLAFALLSIFASLAPAQIVSLDDPPRPYVAKRPATRAETDRRASLHTYVLGLLCERDDRLLEALKAFEDAARLDPSAPAVFKAQVPILLALDRTVEALDRCRTVLELDRNDYAIWSIRFRLHKTLGEPKQARAALEMGLQSARLAEHPEAAQQMYLDLGELCEGHDDPAGAADAFRRAAALLEHPDAILEKGNFSRDAIAKRAAETYERIGHLYRKAKRYDDAAEAYRKAQARSPEHAGRLHLHLARLAAEQQHWPQALAAVEGYLRLQPFGVEAYEMKIDLLHRLQRTAEVVPWLERATSADRFNTGLHLLLAREVARAGQTARAETLYLDLTERAPNEEVYRGLFALYAQEGSAGVGKVLARLDGAVAKAKPAEAEPGAPPAPPASGGAVTQAKAAVAALRQDGDLTRRVVLAAAENLDRHDFQFTTLHFLAVLADRHRQSDAAERLYRRCLPLATPANETLVHGGLLRVLQKAHKFEAVIALCQDKLPKATATTRLLFLSEMARAQSGLDKYDDALATVDRALEAGGDEARLPLQILRLRILALAQRHAEAETACLKLLDEPRPTGEVLELRYLLSSIYATGKQPAKAEEQLELVLKMDPDNATANNDLGYTWADRNRHLDKAEAMIRRALDQDRRHRQLSATLGTEEDVDNASYVDSLGWVLFKRGKIDEACRELERASKLPDSDDPTIWEHLGDVYAQQRRNAPARDAWERALRYYEEGHRRRDPERERALRHKLKSAGAQTTSR